MEGQAPRSQLEAHLMEVQGLRLACWQWGWRAWASRCPCCGGTRNLRHAAMHPLGSGHLGTRPHHLKMGRGRVRLAGWVTCRCKLKLSQISKRYIYIYIPRAVHAFGAWSRVLVIVPHAPTASVMPSQSVCRRMQEDCMMVWHIRHDSLAARSAWMSICTATCDEKVAPLLQLLRLRWAPCKRTCVVWTSPQQLR